MLKDNSREWGRCVTVCWQLQEELSVADRRRHQHATPYVGVSTSSSSNLTPHQTAAAATHHLTFAAAPAGPHAVMFPDHHVVHPVVNQSIPEFTVHVHADLCLSLNAETVLLSTHFHLGWHMSPTRDVTEPANIRIRRIRISCAKSVGFGCGCGFVVRSKLPAIIVTVIQLSYLKLSSCKQTSSEQLK